MTRDNQSRLQDAVEAHKAVCQMLCFTRLSAASERRLLNLKYLLEKQITYLEKKNPEAEGRGELVAD